MRVKDHRDFPREASASALYEELRKYDITELKMEARLAWCDPAGLTRQALIAAIIERRLSCP